MRSEPRLGGTEGLLPACKTLRSISCCQVPDPWHSAEKRWPVCFWFKSHPGHQMRFSCSVRVGVPVDPMGIPHMHVARPVLVFSGNQWAVDRNTARRRHGKKTVDLRPQPQRPARCQSRHRGGWLGPAEKSVSSSRLWPQPRVESKRLPRAEPEPQDLSRCQSRKAPIPTLGQMPACVRSQPKSRTLQSWFSAGDKSTPSWSARSVLAWSSSAFARCWCYCCSLPTTPTRVSPWLSIVVMLLV